MESVDLRLAAALLRPREDGAQEAILADCRAHDPRLAVLEMVGQAAGIVVLDGEGRPVGEIAQDIERILRAQERGLLFVVVAGGGTDIRALLDKADERAANPSKIGFYHLDREGRLHRIPGRHSRFIENACHNLSAVPPLHLANVPHLIAQGRLDRAAAIAFGTRLAAAPRRVTLTLMGACVALFGLSRHWGGGEFNAALLLMGANSGPLVKAGEIWRVLSSAFLHGNVPHLLVNMLALMSLGRFLEALLGWHRFLLLYGAAALAGGLSTAFLSPAQLSVGASGAIWGLLAATLGLVITRPRMLPAHVVASMRPQLITVLLVNALFSFAPGIDLFAHFGGGAVGFGLTYFGLLKPQSTTSRPSGGSRSLTIAAVAAAAVMAASVALSLAGGRPWQFRDWVDRQRGLDSPPSAGLLKENRCGITNEEDAYSGFVRYRWRAAGGAGLRQTA